MNLFREILRENLLIIVELGRQQKHLLLYSMVDCQSRVLLLGMFPWTTTSTSIKCYYPSISCCCWFRAEYIIYICSIVKYQRISTNCKIIRVCTISSCCSFSFTIGSSSLTINSVDIGATRTIEWEYQEPLSTLSHGLPGILLIINS
jgi:hypothetical protein